MQSLPQLCLCGFLVTPPIRAAGQHKQSCAEKVQHNCATGGWGKVWTIADHEHEHGTSSTVSLEPLALFQRRMPRTQRVCCVRFIIVSPASDVQSDIQVRTPDSDGDIVASATGAHNAVNIFLILSCWTEGEGVSISFYFI